MVVYTKLTDVEIFLVEPNASISEITRKINQNGYQTVFVHKSYKILGSISDGDIRLLLESRQDNHINAATICNHRYKYVTTSYEVSTLDKIFNTQDLDILPVIEKSSTKVKYFITNKIKRKNNIFFILAGGKGERLKPLTNDTPKSLVTVGGKPLIVHIIEKARAEGFCFFYISINHHGSKIRKYLGDGKKWGVKIHYIEEDFPLGTCGSLSLIKKLVKENVFVSNTDILFSGNYSDLLEWHSINKADLTIGSTLIRHQSEFGEIVKKGNKIINVVEKPITIKETISGMYVFSPKIFTKLRRNKPIDMPDFIRKILSEKGNKVINFSFENLWIDVGNPSQLKFVSAALKNKEFN